jgi:hypothetical protein
MLLLTPATRATDTCRYQHQHVSHAPLLADDLVRVSFDASKCHSKRCACERASSALAGLNTDTCRYT